MRRLAVTLTVLALSLPVGAAQACELDGMEHGPGGGPMFGAFGTSRLAKAIQGATAKYNKDTPPPEAGVLKADAPIPGTDARPVLPRPEVTPAPEPGPGLVPEPAPRRSD